MLIHGDCLEELKKIQDNSIDLILTDPPFFLPASHYQSRKTYQRNYGDLTPLKVFWDTVLEQSVSKLKRTGHFMVFCNTDSYPVFYEPTFNRFDKIHCLVWDKTRIGLGRIFRNQHELILWARWKEHKVIKDGKLRSDIIKSAPTLSKDRVHPVEKPITLMKELIEAVTNEGDIVLDPFMGGGSTIMAAIELKREYIGIDISKKYFDLVKSRTNY